MENISAQVWFGTSKGVTVYDQKTRDWVTYTQEDGLASNNVTCVVSDEEYVWIGTVNSGVSRYEPKTESWRTFTKKNGLVRNSILSIAVDGDFVWVGTQNGLSRYDQKTQSWTPYMVN